MSETKHVAMNAKQQEQLDNILRGICKERKVAVEADLDSRLSYREQDPDKPKQASWDAYSRFLLSDGHTVYIALRTMKATVSKEVDKYAQGKVEKRLAKQKKRAEAKAAREAKAIDAATKKTKAADEKPKAEPKVTVKAVTKKAPKAAKKPANKPVEELDGIPVRPVKS